MKKPRKRKINPESKLVEVCREISRQLRALRDDGQPQVEPDTRHSSSDQHASILTSLAIPLARVTIKREKERDLRHAVWELRDAIDRYKDAADRGAFQVKVVPVPRDQCRVVRKP